MNNLSWEMIAETPWWAYVFFIYLLWLSWLATKPHTVPVKNLFFLPTLLLILSLVSFYFAVEFSLKTVAIVSSVILLGMIVGWLQFRINGIKAIKNTNQLYIPGTWTFVILLFLLLIGRFYTGYEVQLDSQLLKQPEMVNMIFYGFNFLIGMCIGKFVAAVRCLRVGPFRE